jgi:preprotein translocase subunit SecA
MDPASFKSDPISTVAANFQEHVLNTYEDKTKRICERLLPKIKEVFPEQGHRHKRIGGIPFTDGSLELNISVDMEEAIKTDGDSIMRDIEKVIVLALIDDAWKEHLRNIDDLKDSVQGASFEQKDPLVIYKMEAYNLFEGLIGHINGSMTSYLLRGKLNLLTEEETRRAQDAHERAEAQRRPQKLRFGRQSRSGGGVRTNSAGQQMTETQAAAHRAAQSVGHGGSSAQRVVQPIVQGKEEEPGRNDLCPCGSGKKYKKCHGR